MKTLRLNGIFGFCMLMCLLLSGFASAGCIGQVTGTDYHCGSSIIESCIMDEDLVLDESLSTCFTIPHTANVIIDGNGHKIAGHTNAQYGINVDGSENVTIKNIVVDEFDIGIALRLLWQDAGHKIIGNTISNCRYGILTQELFLSPFKAPHCIIRDNVIKGKGFSTIPYEEFMVTRGIMGTMGNIIENNEISEYYYGIYSEGDNSISGNHLYNNDYAGIFSTPHFSFTNEDGIFDNHACGNRISDISFLPGEEGHEFSTNGDGNACTKTGNYQDASAVAPNKCQYTCSEPWPPSGGGGSISVPEFASFGLLAIIMLMAPGFADLIKKKERR